ncbi:Importin-11 [Balamuthia mandrillaris]
MESTNASAATASLVALLRDSVNPSDSVARSTALKNLEVAATSLPSFASLLLRLSLNAEAELTLRFLAASYFKRVVTRRWGFDPSTLESDSDDDEDDEDEAKKGLYSYSTDQFIPEEEKGHVREQLLQVVAEGNDKIALQLALALAHIADLDFPTHWPDLFPKLLGLIQSQSSNEPDLCQRNRHSPLQRALLVLHLVVKRMAARLKPHKRHLSPTHQTRFLRIHNIALELLPFLSNICFASASALFSSLMQQLSGVASSSKVAAANAVFQDQHGGTAEMIKLTLNMLHVLVVRAGLLELCCDSSSSSSSSSSLSSSPSSSSSLSTSLPTGNEEKCREMLSSVLTKVLQFWGELVKMRLTLVNNNDERGTTEEDEAPSSITLRYLDKYYHRIGKLIVEAQDDVSDGFSPFVAPYLSTCVYNVTQLSGLPDDYLIPCLIFIRYVLQANSERTFTNVRSFWTTEARTALLSAILTRFFVASQEELVQWEEEGEALVNEEIHGEWTQRLKNCAELVFFAVVSAFESTVCPILMSHLQEVMETEQKLDTFSLEERNRFYLKKDAIYLALATGSDRLIDGGYLRTSDLFHNIILNDLNNMKARGEFSLDDASSPSLSKLVRRRLAHFIESFGRYLSKEKELMPDVFRVVIMLMRDPCIVVRLYAAIAWKNLIDDTHFDAKLFQPFLEDSVASICGIVADISDGDTNLQVMDIISILIQNMGIKIRPYTERVLDCLSVLWERSKNNNIQRSAIVRTLCTLTKCLNAQGTDFYRFLLPVLHHSCASSSSQQEENSADSAELHFLEDGLSLWLTILRYVPTDDNILQEMKLPRVFVIAERSLSEEETSVTGLCLKIMECYLILSSSSSSSSPTSFLSQYFTSIVRLLKAVLQIHLEYVQRKNEQLQQQSQQPLIMMNEKKKKQMEENVMVAVRVVELLMLLHPERMPQLLHDHQIFELVLGLIVRFFPPCPFLCSLCLPFSSVVPLLSLSLSLSLLSLSPLFSRFSLLASLFSHKTKTKSYKRQSANKKAKQERATTSTPISSSSSALCLLSSFSATPVSFIASLPKWNNNLPLPLPLHLLL